MKNLHAWCILFTQKYLVCKPFHWSETSTSIHVLFYDKLTSLKMGGNVPCGMTLTDNLACVLLLPVASALN